MTKRVRFPGGLRLFSFAVLIAAVSAPVLRAQNQIVLGDSSADFQLQGASTTQVQANWDHCTAGVCIVAQGSAYGEGSFASSDGQYQLTIAASQPVVFEVTASSGASSFVVEQSGPIAFSYSSAQGSLSGALLLDSLVQGNGSSTATLSGDLTITGGSLASNLSSSEADVSLLLPVSGSLSGALATGAVVDAQVGYPSVVTLAPEAEATCPVCSDFVTGGGWILTSAGAKANFGVHGGIRHGAFWGHLEYNDHNSAPPMTVKSTAITNYLVLSPHTREIDGTADVNGQSGYSFRVVVTDADPSGGEGPGPNHADSFSITLSNGYTASGNLGGGDIEIHKGNCEGQYENAAKSQAGELGSGS